MKASEILALVGMSVDEVRKTASVCMIKVGEPTETLADRNERKFGGVELESERWGKNHTGTYSEILSGADNGNCTTRKGTYCRIKTGDGRCKTQEELRERKRLDGRRRANGTFAKA